MPPYPAATLKLADVALKAAGYSRQATPAELALAHACRQAGATQDSIARIVRRLRARVVFDLVAHADEVVKLVQASRKWPGAR